MAVFERSFVVQAPLQVVADFHRSPLALKRLSPPGVFVQFHQVEPLGEGSIAEFSMWMGPFPVRWRARHENVDALRGFSDIQENGPLLSWRHMHHFEIMDDNTFPTKVASRVTDRVVFEYRRGMRWLWTRVLFSHLGLRILFAYRAWATRRGVTR
ncbi:MAG TPA: hypothetical protein VFF78_06065 [Anaerolineaceae bacterium]|nr:hypothetical protein [Anaerolineaceae bacterium]